MFHTHFEAHKNVYEQDAFKVQSTNKHIKNLNDLFVDFLNFTQERTQEKSHNLWRCNRMNPLRLLRKLISLPDRMPNTGMSIERYLAIDTADAPSYSIPDTDCSNMFIYQLKGLRTIVLRPTSECKDKCRTISVRLQESVVC